ncbi:MAG: hypothetical protein QOF90_3392 [Acetobacteraceae bacterium]|jgi:hypothetical protein|nr:hypothetical protein [Acetobacteraceae bacterium]
MVTFILLCFSIDISHCDLSVFLRKSDPEIAEKAEKGDIRIK